MRFCEAGCYRCLLSYYNQIEHATIDRRHPQTLDLLCRLTRARAEQGARSRSDNYILDELQRATSSLEQEWLDYLREHGYRMPGRAQPLLTEVSLTDFAYSDMQVVVYIDGPHHDRERQERLDAELTARLEDAGMTVIRFGYDKSVWPRLR